MISIFIQYANDGRGREIGLELRTYLKHYNLDPFLAGEGSPDVNYGNSNAWAMIEQKLIDSNVIVAICTKGYSEAEGVQRELNIWKEKAKHITIIPFLQEGISLPPELNGPWRMKFDPENSKNIFCELLISIYQAYNLKLGFLIQSLRKESNADRIVAQYPMGEN